FSLVRTYNSPDNSGGSFGTGWTSIFDVAVNVVKNSTATVRGEDGQQTVFTWDPVTGGWVPPPGAQASLQCGAKSCTVTRFDGVQWDANLVDNNGHMRIADFLARDGQGLKFTWAPDKVTVTVASTANQPYNVVALLDGSGHVTKVTTPGGRSVSYGYASQQLRNVTDANGNLWLYLYLGASNLLSQVTDPLNHGRLSVHYTGGRVA